MAKMQIDRIKAAKTLGLLFAVLHFLGALSIALSNGWIVGWKLGFHFLSIQYSVLPLDIITLVLGTVVAGIAGAIIGWLFAQIWNVLD